jgi:hypothetical protein
MLNFLAPPVDTVRLSTSWLFRANILAAVRALFSLYIFAALIAILAYNSVHNHRQVARHWSYFTYITNWSLGFYFAFSAFHSWTFWRHGLPALERWPRFLQQLQSIFYSTVVVYPFIVTGTSCFASLTSLNILLTRPCTVVFWGLIFDRFDATFDTWSNISVHALNSVYALFELIFARTDPLPWIHMLWLVIMLACYVGVAYITVATEHFYVYSFLNDHNKGGRGLVAGYVFGILAVAIVVFIIVKYLILFRRWLTERRGTNPKVLAHRGHGMGLNGSHVMVERKV